MALAMFTTELSYHRRLSQSACLAFTIHVQALRFVLSDAGLLGKTTIGLDGSKFKAVNSKKNNYNQKR
ncbi:hypothetical protein [Parasediminibacterium paludis]|uniref:hypothetical protein n=1 Tax=Parasediminibacterium paludis TaxID=908966 RepID=UPI00366F8B09